MVAAIAVIVAVRHVALGVIVCDLHAVPVVKLAVYHHGLGSMIFRYGAHALVAAYVLCHLHIVVVGVAALHWRDCAVELGVVLVHEIEWVFTAKEFSWSACHSVRELARCVAACCPLVPVIEIDKLRVALQSLIPAVLEIYTPSHWVFDLFAQSRHVCLGWHVIFVEFRLSAITAPALAHYRHWVLGRRHRSLFRLAFVICHQ